MNLIFHVSQLARDFLISEPIKRRFMAECHAHDLGKLSY